jgi:hypothetical protein
MYRRAARAGGFANRRSYTITRHDLVSSRTPGNHRAESDCVAGHIGFELRCAKRKFISLNFQQSSDFLHLRRPSYRRRRAFFSSKIGLIVPRGSVDQPFMIDGARDKLHATAYLLSQGQLIRKLLEQRDRIEAVEGFVLGPYRTFQIALADLEEATGHDFGELKGADRLARTYEGREAAAGVPRIVPLETTVRDEPPRKRPSRQPIENKPNTRPAGDANRHAGPPSGALSGHVS